MPIKIANTDTKPWYKHFWPWFIIFFPFLAVVAGITTVIIAVKEADSLVAGDYYKEGLAINKILDRDVRSGELGLSASIMLSRSTEQIRVILKSDNNIRLPDEITLSLLHPTQEKRDKILSLAQEQAGIYSVKTGTLIAGSWHIILEPANKEWRLSGRIAIPRETALLLTPENR
ncbi:MAG: FixH family protein [Gammaproteobacteria bacterium]|nr:FixH family protein [Gammaproteobacteria bacterium]MDH5593284.1 FixH family protein [Gammaproteobacteria bacterium]MDH5614338.1 FixH family protein [Gammaproteobacteria bacterium]